MHEDLTNVHAHTKTAPTQFANEYTARLFHHVVALTSIVF